MKAYFISMTRGEETQKGMNALKGILKKDGFVAIKSKIDVGVTHFEQKYYISPTKPGTFIVITELVFHLEIEAIRLQDDARAWLMGYLDRVQKKLDAVKSKPVVKEKAERDSQAVSSRV